MPNNKQDTFSQFEELFWQVSREMSYKWNDIFEAQFPGSQSYILFTLRRKGKKRMYELADSLHLTRGAVTAASDKLIEEGFVTRTRDKNDRRSVYLEITDKGESTIEELQVEGRKAMRSVFHDLSEDELLKLIDIFKRATENTSKKKGENE